MVDGEADINTISYYVGNYNTCGASLGFFSGGGGSFHFSLPTWHRPERGRQGCMVIPSLSRAPQARQHPLGSGCACSLRDCVHVADAV